jgi:nitroreductase/dihydropteridine reductase
MSPASANHNIQEQKMNVVESVMNRHTCKAFDPARKISQEIMGQIETLLRFSPSSTNSQPWHFFIAGSEEGKARVAKAASGFYSFNEAKIRECSHAVVFCTKAVIDEQYLLKLLDREDKDGRFANQQAREGQHFGRSYFVNKHRFELRDSQHWMEKQVYLAVGTLLLGASALGVDACPIEGFNLKELDEELGLRSMGFTSAVIVALGYRSEKDFNAALPKSRLSAETVITRM